MDSLLANYATSDEEEEQPEPRQKVSEPSSTSIFSSLPQPTSSLFSLSLPLQNPSFPPFKPLNTPCKDRKWRRESENLAQTPSVKSFLSSILPTPKNSRMTLGALPSSGSGRRSIIDADVPASRVENEASTDYSNVQNYEGNRVDRSSSAAYEALDKSGLVMTGSDPSEWAQGNQNYENYDGYGNYESYNSLGQYESNWIDRSTTGTTSETAGTTESLVKLPFKRGRNEIPTDIIEVNQDELIKNRPREDQTKSTGIAFGPSYQPASTKGKPTKMHKRKHQISSLYYDMKQKEMELTDRRAKGFLTKAETQAKYGW